jgi:cobalt/nickel transport system permease protein
LHIHDGLLNGSTCVATAAIAAGAVAWSMHRVRREFAERTAPLMGVVAACVFAAQMLNFPIPGATSGHLLGGVLAAVMLGPWCGVLVLTVVLAVQCVLFQDGGITALGANVLNVGVLGSLVGYAIFDPLRRWLRGPAGTVAASIVAAWFSVVLSATACAVELALGSDLPFGPTLGTLLLFHTMIGVGESLITGLAVSFVLRTRPDLVYGQSHAASGAARVGQVAVAGIAIALVLAVFLSPLASQNPDGLEKALAKLNFDADDPGPFAAFLQKLVPMADYQMPGLGNLHVAGSAAGAAGTLVVFAAAFLLARALRASLTSTHSPHAS